MQGKAGVSRAKKMLLSFVQARKSTDFWTDGNQCQPATPSNAQAL